MQRCRCFGRDGRIDPKPKPLKTGPREHGVQFGFQPKLMYQAIELFLQFLRVERLVKLADASCDSAGVPVRWAIATKPVQGWQPADGGKLRRQNESTEGVI